MSRRHSGMNRPPGQSLADRAQQRKAAEQQKSGMLAKMAAAAAARKVVAEQQPAQPQRVQRDFATHWDAVSRLQLHQIEFQEPIRVADGYHALMRHAHDVMNSGEPQVLLCWPVAPTCLSGLVSLLALADVAASPKQPQRISGNMIDVADQPNGLRAVLFPYARTTHTEAREVQVDRDQLARLQRDHLLRSSTPGGDEPALKDYHSVLTRVSSLTGAALDGKIYADFQHPVLDEIIPHGNPKRGCPENGQLLWRTKSKTDLRLLSRSGKADDPQSARYFLYTIGHRDNARREFKAISRCPDLLIIDLTRKARNRLGREFVEVCRTAVEDARAAHPDVGILAVTDDPWTYDQARFQILGHQVSDRGGRRQKTFPARGEILFTLENGITSPIEQLPPASWEGAERITVNGFLGKLGNVLDDLRTIAGKLRSAGDASSSDLVFAIMGKLRRASSLPGSLVQFSEFLESSHNAIVAADYLSGYSIANELAELADHRRSAMDVAPELAALRARSVDIITAAQKATPMASLLDEKMGPPLNASSRSIFIFRSETIADFASARLSTDFPRLPDRLENNMVRMTSKQGLADLAKLAAPVRRQYKRAVVVAPTRATILETLAQPWLPDELIILTDADTMTSAARDATKLGDALNGTPVGRRLSAFAQIAKDRARGIGCHVVDLDPDQRPADDVEFPSAGVVDLRGPARGGGAEIEILLDGESRILARPRTGIVVKDKKSVVASFVELPASEIKDGDEVCVIGPGFIERARTILNITATAAEEIRDYHDIVDRNFAKLAGNNRTEKLRTLTDIMGAPAVSIATALYWVDLEKEAAKPLHDVVPHAPKDWPTFLRFTGALGMGAKMAERFWAWAVIAQRSSRLRAGMAFHDAYKGILTDPHGAMGDNADRAADIRALRMAAMEYVATVKDVRTTRDT